MKAPLYATLLFVSPCFADTSVNFELYDSGFRSKDFAENTIATSYMSAITHVLLYANDDLKMKSQAPLFCEPSTFPFSNDTEHAIVSAFVAKRPSASKLPLALVALRAFQAAFPCKT